MTDTPAEDAPKRRFTFIRGFQEDLDAHEWPGGAEKVRKALGDSLNARNVAFLLGAGCSSFQLDDLEVGVPTMAPLAKEFTSTHEADHPSFSYCQRARLPVE